MTQTYLIAFGSNLGDREYYIDQAIEAIRTSCGPVIQISKIFETEAIGAADQNFLNGALLCSSLLEPESLLDNLLSIESHLGRQRLVRWGNRTIDLDIILCQDEAGNYPVISTPKLSLPHPEMQNRLFVLEPAMDIAADWQHPLLGLSIADLFLHLKKG